MSELPEGWVVSELRELIQPRSDKVEPEDMTPDSPYVSLEHIDPGAGRINRLGRAADVRSTKTRFRSGDVLYGKLRPYLNKVAIAPVDGICSTDILVFPGDGALDGGYLARFLSLREVVEYANHNTTGVQLPRVSFHSLGRFEIRVPPLAEQRRIVAKVEALLARVNAARERLILVARVLENFRRSVLSAACSGRLTNSESTWQRTTIGDVTLSSFYGPRFPSSAYGDGVPTVRTSDMDFYGNINLDESPRVQISSRDSEKFLLKDEDLLITRTGATIGKCAVYDAVLGPAIPSAYLIRFRFDRDKADPRFVLTFLMSPAGQRLLGTEQTAVAQPNVNAETIKLFEIALPPPSEQREIVNYKERLRTLADAVETRVRSALARAERLPEAILAKAFAGKLVATEAEIARRENRGYDPASVLLERIANERKPAAKASRPARKRSRRA